MYTGTCNTEESAWCCVNFCSPSVSPLQLRSGLRCGSRWKAEAWSVNVSLSAHLGQNVPQLVWLSCTQSCMRDPSDNEWEASPPGVSEKRWVEIQTQTPRRRRGSALKHTPQCVSCQFGPDKKKSTNKWIKRKELQIPQCLWKACLDSHCLNGLGLLMILLNSVYQQNLTAHVQAHMCCTCEWVAMKTGVWCIQWRWKSRK